MFLDKFGSQIHYETTVKEFISKLNMAEQEKLVLDYQNAWKGSRTIRMGKDFI